MSRSTRLEDVIGIELTCCRGPMLLLGNLTLRGPSDATRLGYECQTCFRRVSVVDSWYTQACNPIADDQDIEE